MDSQERVKLKCRESVLETFAFPLFPSFPPFHPFSIALTPCGHKALGTRMQILSFEFQLVSVRMCKLQICRSWVNLDQWRPTVNSQVARLLCSRSSHHRGKLWGTRPGTVRGLWNWKSVPNWRMTTSKDLFHTRENKECAECYNENANYALMHDMTAWHDIG